MAGTSNGMIDLDDRDKEVLKVLAHGRANPYHIRERTGLDKGDTNTVLNRLARAGLVNQVDRGLYTITTQGKEVLPGVHPTEIGFVRDIEILSDAEDVKTVRFFGDSGVADVRITDDSMKMFLETAEQVFTDIHGDMAEIRDIFLQAEEEGDENE